MAKYAEGTNVSVARSREEIEKTLKRYHATGFMYGMQGSREAVAFEIKKRRYRIEIEHPPPENFKRMKNGGVRTVAQQEQAQEQEVKRLWRALVMLIKSKLEAVQSGIVTIEDELMPYTVMANNQTVKQWLEPQLEEHYKTGVMPPFLPGLESLPRQRKQIGTGSIIEGEFKSE